MIPWMWFGDAFTANWNVGPSCAHDPAGAVKFDPIRDDAAESARTAARAHGDEVRARR
jgi:hypothetical protein